MKRRRHPGTGEAKPEPLNLTPMIDVVFQLLIFFLLTMSFKDVEGMLICRLPGRGTSPASDPVPELREVRVLLCRGSSAEEHLTDKGRHLRRPREAVRTALHVERVEIGALEDTERDPAAAGANRAAARRAAAAARKLLDGLDAGPDGPPLIIDADPEVPYEHVLGVLDACRGAGIEKIEFAADPRRRPGR
jgi:biopolymer transport protein ExbD